MNIFFSNKYDFHVSRYLKNVTIKGAFGKPDLSFRSDGTLDSVELKIMNLRQRQGHWSNLIWEEVRKRKHLTSLSKH